MSNSSWTKLVVLYDPEISRFVEVADKWGIIYTNDRFYAQDFSKKFFLWSYIYKIYLQIVWDIKLERKVYLDYHGRQGLV